MNAAIIAEVLNAGFSLIATLRRQGMTNAEINARLDLVDQGGKAITVDEVDAQLSAWQQALNAGKQMP